MRHLADGTTQLCSGSRQCRFGILTHMKLLLSFLLLPQCLAAVPSDGLLHTAREVNDFLEHGQGKTNFILSVQAIDDPQEKCFFVQDKTGRLAIGNAKVTEGVRKGDLLGIRGRVSVNPNGETWCEPEAISRLGNSPAPAPVDIRLSELAKPENAYLPVRVTGTVFSITPDEFDEAYVIVMLCDGDAMLPVILTRKSYDKSGLLPDATVRLAGHYWRSLSGIRKYTGPCVIHDPRTSPEILSPPPDNPFAAPPLERRFYRTPDEIARLGPRTASGRVVAVWGNGHLMVRESNGRIVNVTMMDGLEAPRLDETGVFVGYPYSDLMRINLTRARFRTKALPNAPAEHPVDVTVQKLIADKWRTEESGFAMTYHGKLLRLHGTVRSLPSEQSPVQRLYLDSGAHKVPVDISSCPEVTKRVPIGSEVEVTGRCLLETESWRTDNIFPHIRGFAVITRSADDIRVTKYPPWWTPARLMTAGGLFLAALLGAFAWIFAQARRARDEERRTREIAELRMQDRTRLAVELHDTISQNLTGATMQMGTTAQLVETDRAKALRHIDIATRTLDSCREELRNCIWDLRNNALDVPDFNEAIRMTLQRLTGGVNLQIRFNIPREKLSDNTVHALMRIVRELATNAVRHGAAKTVRIAGALEDGILRFSVTDDGRGFDPENRPGLAEGHFGLQGIEERVDELGGGMEITSNPGKGTKVAIWIRSEC